MVTIINPDSGHHLTLEGECLVDFEGNTVPIINGAARFSHLNNYADSFGLQWNKFKATQLDRESDGLSLSRERFFAETRWDMEDLSEKSILEVGSGAGRFSKVVLEHTKGILYSVDYSDAVTANFRNNSEIAPNRFHLFQASIYSLPFPDSTFDKVFCLGVLQHTPDFNASIRELIKKAKPGGEIVVDFYPIRGWWTKVSAKYVLRPITTRISHEKLLQLIDKNATWLISFSLFLQRINLGIFTRFLPLVDLRTLPRTNLSADEFREWVVLDTFDMFSPSHDHPQRISDVVEMFERNGAKVSFAGFTEFGEGYKAAVVRGVRL
jgi:SAM-dependent methyltransferase